MRFLKVPTLILASILCDFSHATKETKAKRKPTSIESPAPNAEASVPPKKAKQKVVKSDLQILAQEYSQNKWSSAIEHAHKMESQPENLDLAYFIEAESHFKIAQKNLSKKIWNQAIRNAQSAIALNLKILETSPESPYNSAIDERLGKSELIIADAHANLKKFNTAQTYFHRLFERYKESKIPSFLTLDQMSSYAKSCDALPHPKCKEWFTKFSELYPKESLEKKFISEKFVRWIDQSGINPYYDRLSRNYKAADPDQVAFDEILPLILKSDYKELIDQGYKFLEKFPKTTFRTRTLYWIAYSYTAKDQKDKAIPLFEQIIKESPISYYAILSAHHLGKDADEYLKKTAAPSNSDDVLLSADERKFVKRASEFSNIGALELARLELKAIDSKKNFSNPFLVFLANETCKNQGYSVCYKILTELNQRSYQDIYSEMALDLYFPDTLKDSIVPTAVNQNLDPLLVTSLIKQESAFSTEAVSSVGAMGLMQLMPFTAVSVDAKIEQSKLTDPKTNIRLGTMYLADLIQRFNGNWVYALAGYNAGPHRVDKWMKEGGSKLGMSEFIESIPYKETRDYVATIIRNYYWYTYKRTGKKLKSLDVFWGKALDSEKPTTKQQT